MLTRFCTCFNFNIYQANLYVFMGLKQVKKISLTYPAVAVPSP